MSNSVHQEMTVQDVVRDRDGETRVFRHLGIDPSDTCTLAQASLKRGLPIEFLMVALDKTAAMTGVIEQSTNHSFQTMLLEVIIEYVGEYHHIFLKNELYRLEQLFDKMIKAHSRSYGSVLEALKKVFLSFKMKIEEHLVIEEEILFPRLRNFEVYATKKESSAEASGASSPINAVDEMKREHELMEGALNEMRTLTSDYTTPEDAPSGLVLLYEKLANVEANFKKYVNLENDLLWPERSSKQAPVEAAIDTDNSAPASDEEEFICPVSKQPCDEGSHARCGKFWDCVGRAMQQRWEKVNERDNDD